METIVNYGWSIVQLIAILIIVKMWGGLAIAIVLDAFDSAKAKVRAYRSKR